MALNIHKLSAGLGLIAAISVNVANINRYRRLSESARDDLYVGTPGKALIVWVLLVCWQWPEH